MYIDKKFGVLTLATKKDYKKAIGLALSLKCSNPGVKTAVACGVDVGKALKDYFDFIIPEIEGLKGFAHKVYLDEYTPFDKTFFFDSDVLIFKNLNRYVRLWGDRPYAACGSHRLDGVSSFGLDRAKIIKQYGFKSLVVIDGAGHALFDKSEAYPLFERARYITKNYDTFVPGAKYADEDVMNIVLTEFNVEPVSDNDQFFSRLLSARRGTLKMDARFGICNFIETSSGKQYSPCMMHFAADEGYVRYTLELYRLFKHFHATHSGLWYEAVHDGLRRDVRPRVKSLLQSLGVRF